MKFVPVSVKQGCSVSVKREVRIRSFVTASTGKRCGGPLRKILGSSKAGCGNSSYAVQIPVRPIDLSVKASIAYM